MGNIGSGFGNPNVRCGFEDGYFPVHAPLGFPNCANYKGTPEQRIAELIRRGYGSNSDVTNAWRKYYAENPSDPLKIEYTKQDPNINNSMSKEAALAERALIKSQKGTNNPTGSWAERTAQTRAYNANIVKNNIWARTKTINAILNNPNNIQRWKNEEQEIIDIENKRLAVLEAENLALIEADLESERLKSESLIQIELEKQRAIDEYIIQQNELVELQRVKDERLENERIENQKPIIEIQPEIIPSVVALSTLIPLALIAYLVARK